MVKPTNDKMQKILIIMSIINLVAVAFALFTIFTFANNSLDMIHGGSARAREIEADVKCLKQAGEFKSCL